MSIGLAQRLRTGTQPLHTLTERAGMMPALLRGALPLAGFQQLQRNLHAVYAALEPALLLAAPALPALARCDALARDLDDLHGPGWATALPVLPAASAYARRLAQLATDDPARLPAHAYVRYLGDLSGGQALARVARRAYGLTGLVGTRFYDFGTPVQVQSLAQALRSTLDALPLDAQQADAVVAEAQWAFGQHVLLFNQLAAALPAGLAGH